MAITFRSDLIAGSRIMLGENGYTKTERIKVLGLPATPADNIGYRAIQALNGRNPSVAYGSPHQTIPGLYVDAMDTESVDRGKTTIIVNIGYSDYSKVTVSVDGTVRAETTHYEDSGRPTSVLYIPLDPGNGKKRFPPGFYPESSQRYCLNSGLIDVDILRPGMVVEFERFRVSTGTIADEYKRQVGTTNKDKFQNSDPETWLCTGISPRGVVSANGGNQGLTIWRERLSFQYRGFAISSFGGAGAGGIINNWRSIIEYEDRRTGQPPGDINPRLDGYPDKKDGNGWREIIKYRTSNFVVFDLPLVFA